MYPRPPLPKNWNSAAPAAAQASIVHGILRVHRVLLVIRAKRNFTKRTWQNLRKTSLNRVCSRLNSGDLATLHLRCRSCGKPTAMSRSRCSPNRMQRRCWNGLLPGWNTCRLWPPGRHSGANIGCIAGLGAAFFAPAGSCARDVSTLACLHGKIRATTPSSLWLVPVTASDFPEPARANSFRSR